MKVAFINTNRMRPPIAPIGLEYVAEAVRDAGHDVAVLDLAWSDDLAADIAAFFSRHACEVAALTLRNSDDCAFTTRESFVEPFAAVVRGVREHSDATVVIGGVGFSVMPETVLETSGADLGIWGEGEFALPAVIRRLERRAHVEEVPNVVHKSGDRWRRTPVRFGDLAALPSRRRDLFDNLRYFHEGGQGGVETKRGCPQKCTYCADPVAKGRVTRLRPPVKVVDEMEALVASGIDHLHTCDAEFNLPEAHARAVCEEMIRRRLGQKLRWYAYCTPRPFGEETARLMREAGCAGINFGVDHGDDTMLRRLGRSHRAGDILAAARVCKAQGMAVMYDLLIGAPGETPAGIRRTIELMKRSEADRFGIALGIRVWPGTALAEALLEPAPAPGLSGGTDPTRPLFYLDPRVTDAADTIDRLVAGDPRFLFFNPHAEGRNYNYNDNHTLVDAIAAGYRGAYWDILRRYSEGGA